MQLINSVIGKTRKIKGASLLPFSLNAAACERGKRCPFQRDNIIRLRPGFQPLF